MNVLQQLRASVAQQGVSTAPPVPTPAPSPAAPPGAPLRPCPFTFGDWLPRTDPQAHPGEAQRAVFRNGVLVAWWRREWHAPLPLDGDPPEALGSPFPAHACYDPSGRPLVSSMHAQAMLEELALQR